MSNNVSDAEKQKKERNKYALIILGVSVISLVVGYFLGHGKGYNKGFDKGVGWE